ncbi:MAG: hypothetical protein WC782_07700 [Methylococcaceae bacterium]|jgi:hypothetical protein
MDTKAFDLNDIENEPSDEQLQSLMKEVSIEAQKKASVARQQLMDTLRKEIRRVNQMQEGE